MYPFSACPLIGTVSGRESGRMDADSVLRAWLNRSGEYSPDYYAYYGPNETSEVIRERLDSAVGPDAAILELGCSSGRHLAHLYEHGHENVYGIDVNDNASEVMKDAYPDLAAAGTFYFDAIENVVTEFDDGCFDAVYSVQTLQHIHHDNEWVFEEVARITDDVLLTVEIEDDDRGSTTDPAVTYINDDFPLYRRDWNGVFTEFDLDEVDSRAIGEDTLRAFRRIG